MEDMPKKKTSLNIDDQTWKDWLNYVVQKTGSMRKVSDETVTALKEYMKNNPLDK